MKLNKIYAYLKGLSKRTRMAVQSPFENPSLFPEIFKFLFKNYRRHKSSQDKINHLFTLAMNPDTIRL